MRWFAIAGSTKRLGGLIATPMDAVVGIGSNLGSREALLRAAMQLLAEDPDIVARARSRLYLTDPIGPPQPRFLNAALALSTRLSPRALLNRLQAIEARLGRVRGQRWGPRTLDLDLLVCDVRVDEPDLVVPHPRLRERSFALAPLLDVAPERTREYGGDLSLIGGPPPAREWTRSSCRDSDELVVEALDDADALALAISTWFGGGGFGGAVRPIESSDSTSFARSAAGSCAIFEWGSDVIRGVGPREPAIDVPLGSVEVRRGCCLIRRESRP